MVSSRPQINLFEIYLALSSTLQWLYKNCVRKYTQRVTCIWLTCTVVETTSEDVFLTRIITSRVICDLRRIKLSLTATSEHFNVYVIRHLVIASRMIFILILRSCKNSANSTSNFIKIRQVVLEGRPRRAHNAFLPRVIVTLCPAVASSCTDAFDLRSPVTEIVCLDGEVPQFRQTNAGIARCSR